MGYGRDVIKMGGREIGISCITVYPIRNWRPETHTHTQTVWNFDLVQHAIVIIDIELESSYAFNVQP
jgi:hypothetical protein